MRNSETEEQGDWARQVPERRFRNPYQNYGWERRQSVLPEFRDPGFHFNTEERKRLAPGSGSGEEQAQFMRTGPAPCAGEDLAATSAWTSEFMKKCVSE